jgi:tubulin polyglutamylase complex subunit 2
VNLPEDMKSFYLCTDGFCLFWSYEYSTSDIKRVGKIHIPHLIQITVLRENLESIISGNQASVRPSPSSSFNDAIPPLNLTTKSKIFELSSILETAKVVLLFETPESSPKIYLLELESLKLIFLADSFSEYIRMAIAHLGLPFWELCFSSNCTLPSWTQQLFLLVAPQLLLDNNEPRRNTTNFHNGTDENPPFNVLDPSVFRNKPRSSRQHKT